ncbi:MAG: 30S ribosomal protein S8 [Chloroflexota bacterium]|nr:30S ribosomal protein S8 [Chloroflexota bacterium]
MPTTDPIADMLTRIRNATTARHRTVMMPTSKMKERIAEILRQEGYIANYSIVPTDGPQAELRIDLIYDRDRQSGIRGLRRVSKPGLRVYTKSTEVPRVLGGLGLAILSTPRGVLSGRQAQAQKVGGEVLCYVW